MKRTLFWHVAPCAVAETDRRFRGAYCLLHQSHGCLLMKVIVRTSEKLVSFYRATRVNVPEDSRLIALVRQAIHEET
jgi:hypothetical protein